MFYGESMFSACSGGSKVALAALARKLAEWEWPLLDAQVANDHLLSLGAERMPRREFLAQVRKLASGPRRTGSWTRPFGQVAARTLEQCIPS
jgi:leucyl/phenylalanyl-tRNA--protein transferase